MPEDIKTSKAQQKAVHKYVKNNYDRIELTVKPKGKKDELKAHAEKQGETLNSFINRAINETIERDNQYTEKPGLGHTASPTSLKTNKNKAKEAAGASEKTGSIPHTQNSSMHPGNKPVLSQEPNYRHKPAAPTHKSSETKMEQLCCETLSSMAGQVQHNKREYGVTENDHIRLQNEAAYNSNTHHETLEEKMERLRKGHPLKIDGVVQRS